MASFGSLKQRVTCLLIYDPLLSDQGSRYFVPKVRYSTRTLVIQSSRLRYGEFSLILSRGHERLPWKPVVILRTRAWAISGTLKFAWIAGVVTTTLRECTK
jgi:hypothetical protein